MEIIDDLCNAFGDAGINLVLQLPCGKIAPLLSVMLDRFPSVSLTREEEGLGIAAGAVLAGGKPLMLIQSSGLGNMVNAIMSLTKFYQLPLPIIISHRGIYKENIAAQVPMGVHLPGILDAMKVEYKSYTEPAELHDILSELEGIFNEHKVKCLLFSPKLFEGPPKKIMQLQLKNARSKQQINNIVSEKKEIIEDVKDLKTRFEALGELIGFIDNKAVICNMGYPSRELYSVFDQRSNFYMLGSLGLASSIGLGVALFTKKDVVVIDGDGSLLMNPNALISIGAKQPKNLTVICLDNGVHGSTGNQPTLSTTGFRLENLAKVCGISKVIVTDNPGNLSANMAAGAAGPNFIRLLIKPGNAKVGTIDLSAIEIRNRFQAWLNE